MLRGGITGAHKMAAICEAYRRQAARCTWPGFGNLQILGATSEDVCDYYERGLEGPGWITRRRSPTGTRSATRWTPMAMCACPQEPGMGYKINWDYIKSNLIKD